MVLPRATSLASHTKNSAAARAAITLILYSAMDRIPFQATSAGAPYDRMGRLPVSILLDNVRSLYNVGAFFRTADAAAIEKLYLCGITGRPPKRAIAKTALGAEETVVWEHVWEAAPLVESFRARGIEIAAIETTVHAVDLFDWAPRFPVCVVFGHEVDGIRTQVSALCDTHVRIPMLGAKHSLNVATAGGVVVYELLRKYRALAPAALR
jgi:23S rRNA (guanosine2251-2'-O)-methyltransferase